MIYILLIVGLFLCSISEVYIGSNQKNNHEKYYVCMVMVVCGFLMGARGSNVGLDTISYINLYNDVIRFPFDLLLKDFYWGSVECGYVLLNKLCSLIYDDYYFCQFVISFIYYLCSYNFIVNNVNSPRIACLLFVSIGMLLLPFNITRQMLAIVIAINSFTYVRKSNYCMSFLLILIATTIHTVALLGLIIPISYYLKDKKGFVKLLPLLSFVIVNFYSFFVALIASSTDKYATYYDNNLDSKSANLGAILWMIEVLFALYIVYSKKFSSEQKLTANFVLLYVSCGFVGTMFNYFERVGYIFIPFQVMLFIDLGGSIKNQLIRRFFYLSLCFCYMILFILTSKSTQYDYSLFF